MAMFSTQSFDTDDLLLGTHVRTRTRVFTLASGQSLKRGAVLGVILGAATVAAGSANVGNGTVGAITYAAGVRPGVYTALCLEPAANGGTFVIYDPDGVVVGRANVGSASTGPLGFTIADGTTDFVAGDRFAITVPDGTTVTLATAAATNGSARARFVLAEPCDATAAPRQCLVYTQAEVTARALQLGAGHTAASVRADLASAGIVVTDTLRS